jgi:hypothetical protein
MNLKVTCLTLSPASLKALIFCNSSGSWIPSYIVGSMFHHARCFSCFPLGFGSSGWWLLI